MSKDLKLSDNLNSVNDSSSNVGEVSYFAMLEAPKGWLKCNGEEVSRKEYLNLFNAIGTFFGEGDGEATFNLPDLRGEFIRGWDDERGVDYDLAADKTTKVSREFASNQVGTLQMVDTPTIGIFALSSKTVDNPLKCVEDIGADKIVRTDYNNQVQTTYISPSGAADISIGGKLGIAGATRPRNVSLLACIKY